MARYSRDRLSSQMRRASRRLRKQGYASQAGQMALASEQARMNEPTVMRPEHRAFEMQAQELFTESQRRAAQPDFDYERDIAPLRGEFFSSLAGSGMTTAEQAGYRRRYEPQLSNLDKDQSAFLQLQEAQRRAREQRRMESLTPVVAQRLKGLLDPNKTDDERSRGLMDVVTDYPEALRDPATTNLISAFDKRFGSTGVDRQGNVYRSLAGQLATTGDLAGIQALPLKDPFERAAFESMAISARGEAQKQDISLRNKTRLSALERVQKDFNIAQKWVLGEATADKNDELMAALRGQGKIPAGSDVNTTKARKSYLVTLWLRLMGVGSINTLPEEARKELLSKEVPELFNEVNTLINQSFNELEQPERRVAANTKGKLSFK